jgi:ring-1,2-phenylacetyl-CoA epoxidase subunit PaaC
MNQEAVKELIYKMADDAMIIGHRNSEWTGIGPVLEEDIAFASMAQDKIGHAWALYDVLHENFGEKDADTLAFSRKENDYKNCQLVEMPIGEYEYSLVRHYLFDKAEWLRYENLQHSSYAPLAQLAKKMRGEIKYHVMHAETWMNQLANGNEESKARIQSALNECYPMALAIFEEGIDEASLMADKVFIGEKALLELWKTDVSAFCERIGLSLPSNADATPFFGARKGFHTEHLAPMLAEMCEVYLLDPSAEW